MTAASTSAQIDFYNKCMVGFSVIFVTAALLLTRTSLHSAGFVAANCINMGLRIAYAVYFIRQYFGSQPAQAETSAVRSPLLSALPGPLLLMSFAASAVVTTLSQGHVCVFVTCGFNWLGKENSRYGKEGGGGLVGSRLVETGMSRSIRVLR